MMTQLSLKNEETTEALGKLLADKLKTPCCLYFNGQLGVGKTRLIRALVQAKGHQGNVKSPTYTLVEPYELDDIKIYHFDLYRLADPEELEYLGIRDYFTSNSLTLIEWPERGFGYIPHADLTVDISYGANADSREVILTWEKSTMTELIQSIHDCGHFEK